MWTGIHFATPNPNSPLWVLICEIRRLGGTVELPAYDSTYYFAPPRLMRKSNRITIMTDDESYREFLWRCIETLREML